MVGTWILHSLAVCLCESSPVCTSFCDSVHWRKKTEKYCTLIVYCWWTNLCTGWSAKFSTSQQSQYLNHTVTSSFYSSLIRIQNLFFHSPHPKVLPYNFPTKKTSATFTNGDHQGSHRFTGGSNHRGLTGQLVTVKMNNGQMWEGNFHACSCEGEKRWNRGSPRGWDILNMGRSSLIRLIEVLQKQLFYIY